MVYSIEDIDKISEFTSWTDRRKVDELLRIDASLYYNLSCSSTKAEKSDAKKGSRKIYTLIKRVDKEMGDLFLRAMDK
jgi:hypothetical protein